MSGTVNVKVLPKNLSVRNIQSASVWKGKMEYYIDIKVLTFITD